MNATVQKWGNSLALRIPHSLAKDVHLHQGSVVNLSLVEDKIIVKPKSRRRYTLFQMLKGITKNNRHQELDWGKPTGRETW